MDYACMTENSSSKCLPRKNIGETCDDSYYCLTGLVCTGSSSAKTCQAQAYLAEGEECTSYEQCYPGFNCEGTPNKVCTMPASGCDGSELSCPLNKYCNTTTHTCENSISNEGAVCIFPSLPCTLGMSCVGTCKRLFNGTLNSACHYDSDCNWNENLYCGNNQKCTKIVNETGVCQDLNCPKNTQCKCSSSMCEASSFTTGECQSAIIKLNQCQINNDCSSVPHPEFAQSCLMKKCKLQMKERQLTCYPLHEYSEYIYGPISTPSPSTSTTTAGSGSESVSTASPIIGQTNILRIFIYIFLNIYIFILC
ncbi:paramecium surface antigen repeat-containing protein [Tieghemostelium lacteum]|uniref:Paramecium surface antigen repeat-containing protein n=1 Tax=Tieghemostelium lacteum TaxID=361077 RepID=A0A151ZC20_TIELA|nr:paramecium surface antigen repeat-containing protein [Tieghemostelium lacteum]|eukprot:KYQ91496.1 paramecium surface antigen repeat-containing protein [Tieghemostelium lacteum]